MIYSKLKETYSINSFIKLFFQKKAPATYTKDGKKQCRAGANRSFSDLLLLTQSRFPKATLKSIVKAVAASHKRGYCYVVWCTQIKKFVVVPSTKYSGSFVSNYSQRYSDKTGTDEISYDALMSIKKKYYG